MKQQETDRTKQLESFVRKYFVNEPYSIAPITGDAGLRDYFRIKTNNSSYIIMDCPPSYASTEPFIDIANFLNKNNYSAPQIIKSDIEKGFLILQDFGNLSIKNYLIKHKGKEHRNIYYSSIDLLIKLQNTAPPLNLKLFDNDRLCLELNVFVECYIPYKTGKTLLPDEIKEFYTIWKSILESQAILDKSIVLRDYHVENIMYLEDRQGIQKLGLLDFQDALIGCPIYDLVSLLEDARIDVERDFALECIQYYTQKKGVSSQHVLKNYHILGAQRNLRILGVFSRKYLRDKDDSYLQYIPRVLKYLEYDLSYSSLQPMKDWLLKTQII